MPIRFSTSTAATSAAIAAAVVSLALAAPASAAPERSSGASAPARVAARQITVGVQQSYSMLPIFVALRHGFFKGTGITGAKFVVFTSVPAMLTAVAQGQLDVGIQTIPGMRAYNQATSGTKLKFIAPGITSGSLVWAVRQGDTALPSATKENWKRAVQAWRGKKVGVPALSGIVDLFTRYMLKQAGLTPGEDVSINAIGAGPASIAALQNGIVDVTTGDSFTLGLLQSQRIGRSVVNFGLQQGPAELLDLTVSGYFTSQAAIEKERSLFAGFTRALARARAYMRNTKNRRNMLDLLVRRVGVTPAEANVLYQVGREPMANSELNRRVFDKTVKAYVDTGVLTGQSPSYSDLVADFAR